MLSDEQIEAAGEIAGRNYRRHLASVGGQTIQPADRYEWHFAHAVAEAAVQAARDGQEPVALLADGRRYKVNHTEEAGVHVGGLPVALCGQWVALVDATDNRHMNYTATPVAPVVPEGWKLVPMKPTSAMLDRAVALMLNVKVSGAYGWTQYARDLWETMLAAAPSRPGDKEEAER